ncbi:hypothetical protein, partial [Aliivibrio kagoshimensis]|uniref:hypothetical protein n=1 Tax=Aliivibrio kagoshimensis TaxID=2910230 RepID=UPI003D0E820F
LINNIEISDKKPQQIDKLGLELEIRKFDFFEKSNLNKFDEVEAYLNEYNSKELAFIIKYLKFPYNRSKSKKTLIDDIVDQLKKRTENVFRNHE